MVVWNFGLLKIIIIPMGLVKQLGCKPRVP